ncbi:hypothetical protein [Chitinimonas sp.]|uniref:hypothetical protein n=1 Tax=Chitinimonas sp. TaxID=1934313 RepID=UPI0035B12FE6
MRNGHMLLCVLAMLPLLTRAEEAAKPPIGRLFFSQAERDELDRIRVGIESADSGRDIRLDGIVLRHGKPPIVWVNGKRFRGGSVAGASVQATGLDASTMVVTLPPPDPRNVRIRVGQTLDPAGGNLREVYQRPPQELNLLLQALGRRGQPPAAGKTGKTAAPATSQSHTAGAPTPSRPQ